MNTQHMPMGASCCKGVCEKGLTATVPAQQGKALSELGLGQSALVCDIRACGELGRRLRDMGLLPGVRVALTSRAPLGDPIAIEMEGCTLSLRCAEAAQVFVSDI